MSTIIGIGSTITSSSRPGTIKDGELAKDPSFDLGCDLTNGWNCVGGTWISSGTATIPALATFTNSVAQSNMDYSATQTLSITVDMTRTGDAHLDCYPSDAINLASFTTSATKTVVVDGLPEMACYSIGTTGSVVVNSISVKLVP